MRGDVHIAGRQGDHALPEDPFVAENQVRIFFSGARLSV
jgi:hypothetical protein